MWQKVLWIALAGGLGALARWGLSGWVQARGGATFPWGTAAANVLGCFLFGVVWAAATERMLLSPTARIVILTGFMGAFTTFSTYLFETGELISDGEWLLAAGNVLGQTLLGLVCLFAGIALGKLI